MRPGPLQATPTPTPVVGPEALSDFRPPLLRAGWFLVGFLVVLVVGWYVVEPPFARGIRRRNRENPTLQEALSRYIRLLVVVVGLFVGAAVAGYGQFVSDSAIVVAAFTLAVGVAGQAVIGSLVSGVVLVADPEFNVGNYIEWAEGEGEVRSITLRVTRVVTPDGELVTIPNTVLTSQAITRPYGRKRLRVVEHVGLSYEADLDGALAACRAAAAAVEGIMTEPEPDAYVDEFAGDAVRLRIQYWIEDPRDRDVFEIRSTYARELKRRLEDAGVTISPASKRELEGRIELVDDA
jgi:small conductance mechanosensitive channel